MRTKQLTDDFTQIGYRAECEGTMYSVRQDGHVPCGAPAVAVAEGDGRFVKGMGHEGTHKHLCAEHLVEWVLQESSIPFEYEWRKVE